MEHAFLIAFTSFLVFLYLVYRLFSKRSKATKNLPPGPWKLPVIGSLHHLYSSSPPHHHLRALAKKYGPLMHLQLGEISTLVVSSPQMAREIYKTHDIAFLNRPESLASKIIFYDSADFSLCPYGDYWREMRKVVVLELLSTKRVRSFSPIREDEVSQLVTSLQSLKGQPVNLSQKFSALATSLTCRAAFNKPCEGRDKILEKLLSEAVATMGHLRLAELFPSVKALQITTKPKLMKMHEEIDDILEGLIKERIELRGRTKINSTDEDLLDVLLRLKDSKDNQYPITPTNIKATICDIYAGGTDSISTILTWAMSEVMKNPRVMKKAQSEIREALKDKKEVSEADILQLSYLKLVIKETLRLHPSAPLLIPRECREQCEIDGYTIPVGTKVIVNQWAIGRDPEHWHDAETFSPERFQNSSTDFMGSHYEFIPCGAGRRMCPGVQFGTVIIEFVLAKLLYHFNWEVPGGIKPQDLDMSETFGMSLHRTNDLTLIPTAYDPTTDYIR